MKKSQAVVKAELMAVAEAKIEELLKWQTEQARPTFSEIEAIVLRLREELSIKLVETTVEQTAEASPVPGPRCAECGKEMGYKDQHPKTVTSLVGAVKIERGYYYCGACHRGLFPPGRAAGAAG
ncbi:MAG: hypothetical protein H0U76_26545 [Ktedonobacteraceae bacterium]|nr:hypothetical protein [Ktedonobacteraceae bacterium]